MNALRIDIAQQALLAHLAAQPTVLEPREEGPLVGQLEHVDEHGPGLDPPSEALGARKVLGVDRGREPGVVQVGPAEDIVFVAPLEDRDDWA